MNWPYHNPMKIHRSAFYPFAVFTLALAVLPFAARLSAADPAPAGFTSLFNGKDLTGWRGGDTYDHRKLLALPPTELIQQVSAWTRSMMAVSDKTGRPHWYGENGELVNDGFGAYATTEKDYGDFEFLVEYKTVANADSGIYLRGVPQVQIWDHTQADPQSLGRAKGSGGLWNNSPGAPGKDPAVMADKPFGEWNKFRVVMVGARVSVWLNDQQVVDHALLENYYDRKTPVPARGPVQLQTHGGEIRWRNIFLREIGAKEANEILSKHGNAGYQSKFDGKSFAGWAGPVDNYQIVEGAIVCKPHNGGTVYVNEDYTDFAARVEFKLPPGGNNGLAIRYPGTGDTAYAGMCELQVLDDGADMYKSLDVRQYHGSAYGMVAAHRGYQRPVGEWNFEEVVVKGSEITVELNGTQILNADLSTVNKFMANSAHPGKDRKNGFFGFAGHNDPVAFRNIELKPLN